MTSNTTATCLPPLPSLEMAWRDVDRSFERFCLTAGIGAIEQMLREDAQAYPQSDRERGFGVVQLRSMRLTANRAQRAAVDGEKLTIERPVIPLRSDRYAR